MIVRAVRFAQAVSFHRKRFPEGGYSDGVDHCSERILALLGEEFVGTLGRTVSRQFRSDPGHTEDTHIDEPVTGPDVVQDGFGSFFFPVLREEAEFEGHGICGLTAEGALHRIEESSDHSLADIFLLLSEPIQVFIPSQKGGNLDHYAQIDEMECGGCDFYRRVVVLVGTECRTPVAQTLIDDSVDGGFRDMAYPEAHHVIVVLEDVLVAIVDIQMPRQLDHCGSPVRRCNSAEALAGSNHERNAGFLVGIVEPVVVELMMQGFLKTDIRRSSDVFKVFDPEVVHLETHVGSPVVGMGVAEPSAFLPLVAVDRKTHKRIEESPLGKFMKGVDLVVGALECTYRGDGSVYGSAGDGLERWFGI